MKTYSFLTILLLLLLASCSPVSSTLVPSVGSAAPETTEESPMPETNPSVEPLALQLAAQAREDLAVRLGISVDQITVSSARAVTWPDSSLGCPQPGMAYTQVLTPGYLIVLEAGGKIYEYHAGRGTTVAFCANPEPPVPGAPADI